MIRRLHATVSSQRGAASAALCSSVSRAVPLTGVHVWQPPHRIDASVFMMMPKTLLPMISMTTTRTFASSPKSSKPSKAKTKDSDDPAFFRHAGIEMHPSSTSQHIFPDKTVKRSSRSDIDSAKGDHRRRPLELVYGYFWMIRELRDCQEKPILTNTTLIPDDIAQTMPQVKVTSMRQQDNNKNVYLPDHLIEQNRLNDPNAQCSVVAVSFRQFGYAMVPSWLKPVQDMYGDNERVQALQINMSEGGWLFRTMSPLLKWMVYQNTTADERDYTYHTYSTYTADELQRFQVQLGLHNVMTCFVLLLDGLGRVRWVASGPPQPEELQDLLHRHIPILLPKKKATTATAKRKSNQQHSINKKN